MRITDSMIARNLLENIQKNQEGMYETQETVSTGKKIREPSDNPVGFSKSSRFRKTISQNKQYLNALKYSEGWIQSTSGTLDQMHNRILDAKDIALKASDLSADDDNSRSTMADQIDDVVQELVSLGNSTHLDKYLFAGTKTKGSKPFSYDGEEVQYNGNSEGIYRRVADNFNVAINIEGSEFKNQEIFNSLIDLKEALENNDSEAINNSIDTIQNAADQILSMNTAVGSLNNQLETTKQRLETTNLNLQSYLSDTEDTDMAEAISQYNNQEMAYKAALQTTSDALNLNILNFIR
ncbi:MAG: flagellar hook-associated protein FlgL [Candidatus Marinimicrobia bacterium]|nr:flagellar hook-associated protein FlgL [Candidatus Neomarinimicrobiota bacterium]